VPVTLRLAGVMLPATSSWAADDELAVLPIVT